MQTYTVGYPIIILPKKKVAKYRYSVTLYAFVYLMPKILSKARMCSVGFETSDTNSPNTKYPVPMLILSEISMLIAHTRWWIAISIVKEPSKAITNKSYEK